MLGGWATGSLDVRVKYNQPISTLKNIMFVYTPTWKGEINEPF